MATGTSGAGIRFPWSCGGRGWLLVLVLLTACDLVPARSGPPEADGADHVPIAVLPVSGTYLDGQLDVQDPSWRTGLRRRGVEEDAGSRGGEVAASTGGAGSTEEADVVTGRLLDADGGVLVEAHRRVEPSSGEGEVRGDIAEPGSFGFHLGVVDPSAVAILQVDAGEERFEQQVGGTVSVEMTEVPSTIRDPLDIGLVTRGDPTRLHVEVHDASHPARELPVHGGSVQLDPTRYGRGTIHLAALATDGLAADLTSATVEIDVEFEEHLDIVLDIEDGPVRVSAGERYLVVPVTVVHFTAPGEARMQHPPSSTVSFSSDVDGALDDTNLSAGYGELYAEVAGLTPGTHTVTVSVSGDGMTTERPVEIHIER